MVKAAKLKKTDTVIEVGPGFGPLTLAMAGEVDKVIAFEIEQKLRSYWADVQSEHNNIDIVWGDILHNWQVGVRTWFRDYKVVANLPYQITSRVLRMFLEARNKPDLIAVMVQREVADRICAGPGNMSKLSVSVQFYGEPKIVARVPKGNFWPRPDVDSAIVLIDVDEKRHEGLFGHLEEKQFFKIVRAGFANKRKQLLGNLSKGLDLETDKVRKILRDVTGNEKIRAQDLNMEEWGRLVRNIYGIK